MLSTLSFSLAIFAAVSLGAECDNQNRDSCADGTPLGPDTEQPLACSGFDCSGTYPSPREKAMTVCKDENMGGTCTNVWTGVTGVVPNGWNDVISSSYVFNHYRCKFYCDGREQAYMTTLNGPYTVNWINSWNDCISSYSCERRCQKTQEHCSKNTSGCIDNSYIKCKTCKTGYINKSGKCEEDETCVAVELTIDTVELATESLGVPDEMTLGTLLVKNCQNDQTQESVVSDSETVSHTVDTTYSFSKSLSETIGQTMSASVTMTVKGEIIPGFGADVSTTLKTDSSWSQTMSSSSTSTQRETDVTTHVWTHSETIHTSPYHNSTFTSIGQSTPGKIQWTGTMKCYNKLNKLTKTKSVSGSYSGANVHNYEVELTSVPCGAPQGFNLHENVQCDGHTIDTGDVTYSNILDAQNACQKLGSECAGVMDINCDGVLDYYLCANDGTSFAASKAGTCIYTPVSEASTSDSSDVAARLEKMEAKLRTLA